MDRIILLAISLIVALNTFAQSTTTISYDGSGNRIAKKMQGSSPHPTVTASSQAVNPSQPVTLVASGCTGTLQWSTGQQGASITVTPTVSTQYSASCVVAGCTPGVGKVAVDVIQCVADEVTVAASTASIAYGQPVTLNAYGCSGSVQWSTGEIGNIAIVKVYEPATNFTATCNKAYCPNSGSAVMSIAGTTSCAAGAVLITQQTGNWNAASTWACGRIPTLTDEVYIRHVVTVDGITANAKALVLGGGYVIDQNNGFVNLQPY